MPNRFKLGRLENSGKNLLRVATLLVSGVVLLGITVAATLAQVAPRNAAAMAFWPVAAMPQARAVERSLEDNASPDELNMIQADAIQVLLREPVNVVAARVAGLAASAAGDGQVGRRIMRYAEGLSRRDLGTQVMLIEFAVADGDIPRVLHHYDTALRTGDAADQLLMPVLVAAASDATVATRLIPMLETGPPWRLRFVYSLLTATPWPESFPRLILAARLNVSVPVERDFLTQATKGLVAGGSVDAAARLYAQATGIAITSRIRNGNFAGENRLMPFDWEIIDEPGLAGLAGPVEGVSVRSALSLDADPGRSGIVARQLLRLDRGRYRLRFMAGGGTDADRSRVVLTCNVSDTIIVSVPLFGSPVRARISETDVTIPVGCDSQSLAVQAGSDINAISGGGSMPWISAFSLARI